MRSSAPRANAKIGARLIQVGFLVALIVAWFVATDYGGASPFMLPHPGDVWSELVAIVGTGAFISDFRLTLFEVAIAFTTSAVSGLFLGYVISRSRYIVRVIEPLLSSLYAIPVILFLPLFLLFFGLGVSSKIAMGITTSFFPIVLSTIAGFANVDKVYVTAARSMGASNMQLLRHVLLPAALPVILTGLRMGFIVAFLSILGAEAIASYAGLGHQIVERAERLEVHGMFAYIALVVATTTLLNMLLSRLEQRGQWQ